MMDRLTDEQMIAERDAAVMTDYDIPGFVCPEWKFDEARFAEGKEDHGKDMG